MTKSATVSKKPHKQHSPEFRSKTLKLAERIGVVAAARGAGHTPKGCDILREAPEMKYVFIEKYRSEFSIKAMCRVLRVDRSGWYAWRLRRHQLNHR